MEEGGHDVVGVTSEDRDAVAGGAVPDANRLIIRSGYLQNESIPNGNYDNERTIQGISW